MKQSYERSELDEFVRFWKSHSDMSSIGRDAIVEAFGWYNRLFEQDNRNWHDLRTIQSVARSLNWLYFRVANREVTYAAPHTPEPEPEPEALNEFGEDAPAEKKKAYVPINKRRK